MKNCWRTSYSSFKNSLKKRSNLLLPLLGLASLIWFLVRVIPKPSRALYPCQRAATPILSGFVAWIIGSLTGLFPSILAFNKGKQQLRRTRLAPAFILFAMAFGFFVSFMLTHSPAKNAGAVDVKFVAQSVNQPIGTGIGVNPGRVSWVYNPSAVLYKNSGYYWNDTNNDQTKVNEMVSKNIRWLSGASTDSEAWTALFKYFNKVRGNGEIGYQAGQKIAIKVNMNSSGGSAGWKGDFCTSPQSIYAVVNSLIEYAGVKGADITVYDASRGIGNPVVDKIRANTGQEYQDVKFVVSPAKPGTGRINAVADTTVAIHFAKKEMQDADKTFLPTCVTEASYLINIAQFKGHGLGGVTLCAKNFFGSLYRPSNPTTSGQFAWTPTGTDENSASNVIPGTDPKVGPGMHGIHGYMNPFYVGFWYLAGNPMGSYNSLVDIIGDKDLGGKVVLFMIDALYSSAEANNTIVKWKSFPFNNGWTASIFASQDIIALESVGVDFMANESQMTNAKGSLDNYLHEGALANDPPSGTFYDPEGDGTRLASLGVHEHWNNVNEKLYTKNMGTGEGIELARAPFIPTNLVATGGKGFVDLSWDTAVLTDSYTIKRSETSGSEFAVVASGLKEPAFSDTLVTGGKTYYYVVSAVNKYDESYNSGEVSATPETPVAVETEPAAFTLSLGCNPNPFNSSARITYSLPKENRVSLQIFNMLGQRVAMLIDTKVTAGSHSLIWNGRSENGETVSSGMYLIHLKTESGSLTRKVVLLY